MNKAEAPAFKQTMTMYDEGVYQSIVENATDGIIIIDENGIIQFVNPVVNSLFGYADDELYGQDVKMLMPFPHSNQHNAYIHQYKLTGYSHIIGIGREVTCSRKNGDVFPASLSVSEVAFQGKKLFAGIIHDRTSEKLAEERLQQYSSELEGIVAERTDFLRNIAHELEQAKEEINNSLNKEKEINKLKTRFVSIASHEFRTPLSSIQLSAALIERYYDRLDKEKVSFHLNRIRSAVAALSSILNDLLSVEKAESGKIKARPVLFDLEKLCIEITDEMRAQAGPGQLIRYRHTGDTNLVMLDNNLLRHSLLNLLSNALKYSGTEALIEFKTQLSATQCSICIADNGIGIPLDDQQRLFEPFFRAGNVADIEGTGLGLNIVKRYTALMNGSIELISDEHQGTKVSLTFPLISFPIPQGNY